MLPISINLGRYRVTVSQRSQILFKIQNKPLPCCQFHIQLAKNFSKFVEDFQVEEMTLINQLSQVERPPKKCWLSELVPEFQLLQRTGGWISSKIFWVADQLIYQDLSSFVIQAFFQCYQLITTISKFHYLQEPLDHPSRCEHHRR